MPKPKSLELPSIFGPFSVAQDERVARAKWPGSILPTGRQAMRFRSAHRLTSMSPFKRRARLGTGAGVI